MPTQPKWVEGVEIRGNSGQMAIIHHEPGCIGDGACTACEIIRLRAALASAKRELTISGEDLDRALKARKLAEAGLDDLRQAYNTQSEDLAFYRVAHPQLQSTVAELRTEVERLKEGIEAAELVREGCVWLAPYYTDGKDGFYYLPLGMWKKQRREAAAQLASQTADPNQCIHRHAYKDEDGDWRCARCNTTLSRYIL